MKALYPDLTDNQIILTLNDEDITNAKNQAGNLQGIIDIPSNTWNHVITAIENEEIDYYNKMKINVNNISDETLETNTVTITIPQNPTLNQNDVLENIDIETSNLITYNAYDEIYGTNINIDLSQYKNNFNYTIIDQSPNWRTITQNNVQINLADLFINYNPNDNQLFSPNNTLTIQVPTMSIPTYNISKFYFDYHYYNHNDYYNLTTKNGNIFDPTIYNITQSNGTETNSYCFILQYQSNIIISYGKPPIGSYYCINNNYIDSLNRNDHKILYDNNFICYDPTRWRGWLLPGW